MPAKNQFIKKFQEDQQVNDIFVVLHKQLSAGRNGRNYLRVTLGDKTGQIETRVWEGADEMAARFEQGELVFVNGIVTSYQGVLQVKAHYIENLERDEADKQDWADFLPCSAFDLGKMWSELTGILGRVADPNLKRLLGSFTGDEAFIKRFTRATAAKMMHHAYIGGLLEHTLGCVRLAERIAPLYPVNRDLLVVGAFIHDLGKLEELSDGAGFEYTDEGRLLGHIVQGVVMLKGRIASLGDFPPELALHLEHFIVSHHGENEWGAPKRPKTPEALILHAIDNIDAKVAAALQAIDADDGPQGDWTPFVRLFDRPLFRGRIEAYPESDEAVLPTVASPAAPPAQPVDNGEERANESTTEDDDNLSTPKGDQGSLF